MDNRPEKTKGMNEEELLRVCTGGDVVELSKYPDWTSEVYGLGKFIRRYAFYPKFLPLYISTDHGPGQHDFPNSRELNTKMPVHFYHSPRLVNLWSKYSKKPCYTLYSPYVFYRKKSLKRNGDAKGTIAFPTHSTHYIDVNSDINKYIDNLLALPAEYQPVAVCLYFLDVQKGMHKPFIERGIPTYSAGHWFHHEFVENFYSIINNFRYATSDSCGSYLFYSVEFGLPFFIMGEKPLKFNSGDLNTQMNLKTKENFIQLKRVEELFSKLTVQISEEQSMLVAKELGLVDGLTRLQLCQVLYKALFKVIIRNAIRKLKRPFTNYSKTINV